MQTTMMANQQGLEQAGSAGWRALVLALVVASLVVSQACAPLSASTAAATAKASHPITVTAHLGAATKGTKFSGAISATGGTSPYHFSLRFGSLPAGLTLDKTSGAITGTPTKAGASDFTVRASSHDWLLLTDLGLHMVVAPNGGGVTVTVTPSTLTIASGGSQQLVAAVAGSSDQQVKWGTSAGTISTSGLFTAPTVTAGTVVTVTATSADDDTAEAHATISVAAPTSTSLTINTSVLPDASQGTAYSAGLFASGGTQPYTWRVQSVPPAGLSLDAAGRLSGSPTKTGSFSFGVAVTDAASHSVTASLSLNVDVPNPNGKFDGPAELPRVYVQSAMADTPANGKTWPVTTADGFQSALKSAACGDTISLAAGSTLAGSWTFPAKTCDDQHWIIIRTSAPDASLPPEGTRLTPCYAGVSSLPGRPALNCKSVQNVVAKLVMDAKAGSGPIAFTAGANHYRFVGLEITRLANGGAIGNLVYPTAGSTGDHIIFDRVWMHGTVHDDTTRGIYLSGLTSVALVDSYLNDFHCESNTGTCTDAQAISGGLGTSQDGSYKIVNNFLESAAENILFGGGHATTTPTDIEIRHNHFFKPLTWMPGQAGVILGNHGNPFVVKNHFELKNAQRVLFEGNIAENSWGGFSQPGFTVVLTPKNQITPNGDVCPICQVTDVTIRNSKFSHMGSGFQIANALDSPGGKVPPRAGMRYSIHDVVLDDISHTKYQGQGQLAQISTGHGAPLLGDLSMRHITAFPSHTLFDVGNDLSPKMPNFIFSDSIVTTGAYPVWTVGGDATTCAYNHNAPTTVLGTCFANYTFSSNMLIGVPSRFPVSSWPGGNALMADGNSVGFVNFNNGDGGDYHLKSGTALASDGKPMGADIDAIAAATQGAD